MIGISRLYCGAREASDLLRYAAARVKAQRPVVVWNITRNCNLRCEHCYAGANLSANTSANDFFSPNICSGCKADNGAGCEELSTESALGVIDDLADFGVPVLLFSGGEPLLRADLPVLLAHAAKRGLRTVISTNGTLVTEKLAQELAFLGVGYVGVSLDGVGRIHDELRGSCGAFEKALQGLDFCSSAGLKTGLRFTITTHNQQQIGDIFSIAAKNNISRICFYHLVRTGRATNSPFFSHALSHAETRQALDTILKETKKLFNKGLAKEVLTVDNHADGPYVWLKMLRENPAEAELVYKLLEANAAASSGLGIACISWNGDVYADQFLRDFSFGRVTERSFGEIWSDPANELLSLLRERKKHVKGRCKECRFLDICGGNFRARAFAETGDIWAADPACYLTDEEIAK